MKRVVVQWSRFGPYHLARLRGAAEASEDLEITGLEIAARDHYDWAPAVGRGRFLRRTLFEDQDYGDLSPGPIRAAVTAALDEINPDAVAVNGWSVPEARAALSWCRSRKGRGAIVMSETKADGHRRRWWKEWTKRRILRSCRAALVGGRPHADYVRSLGIPEEGIFLGYDAVDNRHFEEGADRARSEAEAWRGRLGLPPAYFFLCTRFLPRKNVDGFLGAYSGYLRSSEQPWGLAIAGSGEEEGALKSFASTLGLPNVRWPGFLQYADLPVWFGLAGAFVHPAKAEPWGLVVNEAAASGLPLLVSRSVGAASELVEDGANGFLFDPGSVEEMTGALLRMSTLPQGERNAMGAKSREIANRWSPRRFGEGLLAAVEAALTARA